MNIHQNIRDLRKARGLTQEQLAEAMGVSTASVSKWENGQCAPDLAVLTAIADFFQISVDAILGHRVDPGRMEAMISEAEALAAGGKFDEAAAQAEKLLRNYPNSPEVAEKCSQIFYHLFIQTLHKPYMERSIALTLQLFVLQPNVSESENLERMASLATRYELIQDWESALQCYMDSNVAKINNRHIARCLMYQNRNDDALSVISDVIRSSLYQQLMDATTLSAVWVQLGNTENAIRTLEWAVTGMEAANYNPRFRMILYVETAKLYEQTGDLPHAKEAVRKVAQMAKNIDSKSAPFLSGGPEQKLLSNMPEDGEEMLKKVLSDISPVLRRTAMAELE